MCVNLDLCVRTGGGKRPKTAERISDVFPPLVHTLKSRIYITYLSRTSLTAPGPFVISAKYWHTRGASPASIRSTPKISLSVSRGFKRVFALAASVPSPSRTDAAYGHTVSRSGSGLKSNIPSGQGCPDLRPREVLLYSRSSPPVFSEPGLSSL